MTTFIHIAQVHPVENGEPNLKKVVREIGFDRFWPEDGSIDRYIDAFNVTHKNFQKAVYRGRMNTETGELE